MANDDALDMIVDWVRRLQGADGASKPRRINHRILHPGPAPASGNGLIAAQPLQAYTPAGEDPQAVSLLHYIDLVDRNLVDTPERSAAIGALLTFASGRRCQVLSEIPLTVEGTDQHFLLPLAGRMDSELAAPMPEWEAVDTRLRDALARLASADGEDASAIFAAMHLHYSASLLLVRDYPGAYALAVGAIETLAQRFGKKFSDWADWDRAGSWDKWMAASHLDTDLQGELRQRLLAESHIRLAETFASYVTERLPGSFWSDDVRTYVWGYVVPKGSSQEGSWSEPHPRGPVFEDPATLRRALKFAYRNRSQYLHAGVQNSTFVDDLFAHRKPEGSPQLSFAQLRSALYRLIELELEAHGDPAPNGLEGTRVELGEPSPK